jgi:hypothetical protein
MKPFIPRQYLFVVAGLLWTAVGLLLCWRALGWLNTETLPVEFVLESIGIFLAVAFYFLGFSKIARKNIARICKLPERASLFAFTAWKGYIIIGTMITAGIIFRNSSIPKDYLAVPYTAMGGALLLASGQFYYRFIRIVIRKEPCSPQENDSK